MEITGRPQSLVFPGFKFGKDDPLRALELAKLGVGGFCLYKGTPASIRRLTSFLSSRASKSLVFCADYEEGIYSQCQQGTPLPSNMGLGASGSARQAFLKGLITAREARALGVGWVLAPVLDLATDPRSPIVNVRSFSDDPATAARLGRAYLAGLRKGGALSCLKHFPGHGQTALDSHLALPRISSGAALIKKRELSPFRRLARAADAVMAAHVLAPGLSAAGGKPVSLSAALNRVLRGAMGFRGVITTDALTMGAVSRRYPREWTAARLALAGGADILLVPRDPMGLVRRIESEAGGPFARTIAASVARISRMRRRLESLPAPREDAAAVVGCLSHLRQADAMARHCLAWGPRGAAPRLPSRVFYWEPETEEGKRPLPGREFLKALRSSGVAASPWRGQPEGTLLIASFLKPRAGSGVISHKPQVSQNIMRALRRPGRSIMVSLGSPFVLARYSCPGLCAFSDNPLAQRAAALALSGRIRVRGRMPVRLGSPPE